MRLIRLTAADIIAKIIKSKILVIMESEEEEIPFKMNNLLDGDGEEEEANKRTLICIKLVRSSLHGPLHDHVTSRLHDR